MGQGEREYQRNLFEFSEARDWLSSVLKEKKDKNPKFSLRAWSRQLGFTSPNMLSMILRKERRLRRETAQKIAKSLKLSQHQTEYLESLCSYNNAKTNEEQEYFLFKLEKLRPKNEQNFLSIDKFRLIADWHHIAILELIHLSDFKNDSRWISKRLGSEISPSDVSAAIRRLKRLGLVEEKKAKLSRINPSLDSTVNDIPSSAIQKFHSQMIEKAQSALRNDSVQEREISSNTFCIRKADLPKAQKLIRDFQDKLQHELTHNKTDEVYQLNIQFFKLTRREE